MGTKGSHTGPVQAALTGIFDRFKKSDRIAVPGADLRLDRKTCVVTGANSGLGFAIAAHLAQRGARVILACRRPLEETVARVKKAGKSELVEIRKLDLRDFASVREFCAGMAGTKIDRLILNAGVVTAKARKTEAGFDEMFQVNYLANYLLVDLLLRQGSLPNEALAHKPSAPGEDRPRIVFVGSESHRDPDRIDFDSLGIYRDYGTAESLRNYGYSKLLISTNALDLSRKLNPADRPVDISVHHFCPGAVNSNIARDVPAVFLPLLKLVFLIFFQSPRKAALPALYLVASPEIEGRTGLYLHTLIRKDPSPLVLDPENGERLRAKSEELLANFRA